jgi:hypothetical protein
MIERPLLFSGPMVTAILAGEKTQTRRVVKPRPGYQASWLEPEGLLTCPSAAIVSSKDELGAQFEHPGGGPFTWVKCPYGKPGDRLWIRETCKAEERAADGTDGVRYLADDAWVAIANTAEAGAAWLELFHYGQRGGSRPDGLIGNSVPSIHMPRWASRLLVEIVDVRIERLQDISEGDALAEGAKHQGLGELVWAGFMGVPRATCPAVTAFAVLWSDINGAASWSANPWVWVVEFKRVQA